jgi:hypothetical protein
LTWGYAAVARSVLPPPVRRGVAHHPQTEFTTLHRKYRLETVGISWQNRLAGGSPKTTKTLPFSFRRNSGPCSPMPPSSTAPSYGQPRQKVINPNIEYIHKHQ